jgi:transposase
MWRPEHRRAADRRGMRYLSDLTDAEWALVEPMIPAAKHGGRKRSVDVREVLNGIFYVLATGCQWNAVPTDLPPKSTIYESSVKKSVRLAPYSEIAAGDGLSGSSCFRLIARRQLAK